MSLGWPERCSWVWAASTTPNPSHNNGVKRSLPKPCLSAWHPTALLGSQHLEPKPHREASSLVTRAMQHPVLSAHKCAQKPVLHVVAIYYRRGPQEAYSIDYKKVEIDFIGSGVGGKLAYCWEMVGLMRKNKRTKGSSCPRRCLPTFFCPM